MYVMDEYDFTNTRIGPKDVVPVNRDIFGLAAQYEPTAPYRAGISYIQAGDALKAVRLSGAYDLTPRTTIGALYQHTDYDTSDNENAFTLSASHKVAQTPWTAYGQVDLVDNYFGASNDERQRLAVGGKYAFNRATTGHVYGAYLNEETSVVNSTANTTKTTETSGFGVGAGLEYRF